MNFDLAMSVLNPKINFTEHEPSASETNGTLKSPKEILSPYDMKRLESYTNNLSDYHMILDLVPVLAHQYFQGKIPVTVTAVQGSILLCMGLQNQDLTYVEGQMKKLDRKMILSSFIKTMKKFYKYLYGLASKEMDSTLPRIREVVMEPHGVSVDDDLNDAAKQVQAKMKAETEGMLNPEMLQKYAIVDREAQFDEALQNGTGKISSSGLVSVKSNRGKVEKHEKHKEKKDNKKRERDGHGSKSSKKKRS